MATVTPKIITKKSGFTLEITNEEAAALLLTLARVGGSSDSIRQYTDEIFDELNRFFVDDEWGGDAICLRNHNEIEYTNNSIYYLDILVKRYSGNK